MSKFINRLLLFICICLGAVFLLLFVPQKIVDSKTNFKIPANIDKIIIGHSHPECAYNDSLIKGFANYASSGEAYFYNYYKLIQLIKNNPAIKTVFIEYANNQIKPEMDEWIIGDYYLSHKYSIFGPFLDAEAHRFLITHNPGALLKGKINLFKRNLTIITTHNYSFMANRGAYLYLVRDKTDSLVKAIKPVRDTINLDTSKYNISYLRRMVNLCKQNNVSVYLVRSPMHEQSEDLLNERLYEKIRTERFADVPFLDFVKFPVTNSEFGDMEHLNHKGAEKFSVFFNRLLQTDILTRIDKQGLIDSMIIIQKATQKNKTLL